MAATSEKPPNALSGRIINCVSQLPYKISRNESLDPATGTKGSGWQITPVGGNSALYSSLYYLRDSTEWEEHVVGWTGEIDPGNGFAYVASTDTPAPVSDQDSKYLGGDVSEDPLYLSKEQKRVLAEMLQNEEDSKNKLTIHPVWLLRRDQHRWREYAENVIWPALHYILNPPSDGQKENTWWYDYVKFNEAYAMKVAQIYQPGDIIWVHDYYLMLLPQLLRMRFQDALIAYFHHTPWPSNEYFRCLSKRKLLLDGILGSNRVCFQNHGFARHFVSGCKRLLDATSTKSKYKDGTDEWLISAYGGDVVVDSLPIGVNTKKLLVEAFTPDIDQKVVTIKQAYAGKKIIFGSDRLDTVNGVVQKLQAFEIFLAMFPQWRDKAVLIQASSLSSTEVGLRLEQQVNDLVNSINSRYGNLNFSPVQHYHMVIPRDVYLSLLRAADLCVITSVRDGMNTTALEYVTVKSKHSIENCYANPLVLSEFSGSSTVLKDALIINPWDSVAVAKAIHKALLMSPESKATLENKLWSCVPTIQAWNDSFLDRMVAIAEKETEDSKITPALNRPLLLQNYKLAKRRLFLFDYDGTLTPIVQDPAAAIPSARLFRILAKLAADPKNQIWIISGRDQQFLNKWLGSRMPQLGLSAEHGCFLKDVSSPEWVNLTTKFDMSWQIKVNEVMEQYTTHTPGSSIERKKVALTWHYRRADPELGEFNASKLKKALEEFTSDLGLEVMEGKANVEVRPKFVNKGEIVKRLVWHPHGTKQLENDDDFIPDEDIPKDQLPEFILCLGDDATDEDMFTQLNSIEKKWNTKFPNNTNEWGHFGIYPVTVGSASKKTVAKAHLTDPEQVLDTLGLLVGDVSLFQSGGTVDLDDRGHLVNSESSVKSEKSWRCLQQKKCIL